MRKITIKPLKGTHFTFENNDTELLFQQISAKLPDFNDNFDAVSLATDSGLRIQTLNTVLPEGNFIIFMTARKQAGGGGLPAKFAAAREAVKVLLADEGAIDFFIGWSKMKTGELQTLVEDWNNTQGLVENTVEGNSLNETELRIKAISIHNELSKNFLDTTEFEELILTIPELNNMDFKAIEGIRLEQLRQSRLD